MHFPNESPNTEVTAKIMCGHEKLRLSEGLKTLRAPAVRSGAEDVI